MMNEALMLLLDTLIQPFVIILLLRFHAVWLRAPMRNPIGEFVMAITDFMVLPLRKKTPTLWGLDTVTLLLALLFEVVYLSGMLWARDYPFEQFPLLALIFMGAVKLIKISLYLLMAAVFAQVLLSWFRSQTPVASLLDAFTAPFLLPLRRIIPPIANLDLSPLALFLILQLTLIVPVGALEMAAARML
jgi:YggT family protein